LNILLLLTQFCKHHRIIGLGWKGLLEAIKANPPAVNGDVFSLIRLLRTTSNLALNASRMGHQPPLWATHASVSEFKSTLSWWIFSLPLVLSQQVLLRKKVEASPEAFIFTV